MSVLAITGTGTEVGKTIVTAAIAALCPDVVTVLKPAQTGLPLDGPRGRGRGQSAGPTRRDSGTGALPRPAGTGQRRASKRYPDPDR